MATTTQKKPLTKTQFVTQIAEETGLTKKEVSAVLDAQTNVIRKQLTARGGAGAVTIPGLLKIQKHKVPARAAKKGVPNPFKPGELMDVAARPAFTKVKVRALKGLKDMV